uniref:Cytochrome c domain-containing protein n=1 Tax=Solibacter usitatus (strain Ellin6076) TaxID=234267 RepID=Q01Z91_SOLUE
MKGVVFLGIAIAAHAADPDFFESKVRPVFAKTCYPCHTESRMGGLRLDSADGIAKGGNSGPPVQPGKPDESLLVQAIRRTHERIKMPPSGKLPDSDIAAIVEWVKSGAVWPAGAAPTVKVDTITAAQRAFWSFQAVRKPPAPKVKDTKWARTDIDRFVLAKLEQQGLKAARPADRRILLRRVTLDLTGLPPTPEEVDAFLADKSPDAFAKVVDRLLASPRYGERWGRLWLDVARYSDERLNSTESDPIANAFRYRDWVIQAFNRDMPYDVFVKAQIAGDLMPSDDPLQYRAGTGFYAMSPEMQDDRVDATTRGFLGLTVACAQCHYHKFDPIPQSDFYSLQGVFASSQTKQFPLAPKDVVEKWDAQKKALEKQETALKEFTAQQSDQLAGILASQTARYLLAARDLAPSGDLDRETVDRWKKYLEKSKKGHPYLQRWMELAARNATREEMETAAREFQAVVEGVYEEKHLIDEHNKIRLGLNPDRNAMSQANLESLAIEKYVLWRDVIDGIDRYTQAKLDRFLNGEWKRRLLQLREDAATLKKALPPQYPFLQTLQDAPKPHDIHVAIRGDVNNPGELAPRHLPSILCAGAPPPFRKGSGRLELAEGIASASNPLTARVIVNRIWLHHFGRGLVETPSNFGNMGSRPSNPELLDYLAARLVELKWSMKALHREILLSSVYGLSAEKLPANQAVDPDNRLQWRANWRRMDVETMRDSLLFVAGKLDLKEGGEPAVLHDANHRRTVYGFVSRRKLDPLLALFDFPNPNNTSEQRSETNVPLQRLFLMNSSFVEEQAAALAKRLTGTEAGKVREAYRTLYGRAPDAAELQLGIAFAAKSGWNEYARVLLNANEFDWVN